MNSDRNQARLSSLVKPREGHTLNVMNDEAHRLQQQHRERFDHRRGIKRKPITSEGAGFAILAAISAATAREAYAAHAAH